MNSRRERTRALAVLAAVAVAARAMPLLATSGLDTLQAASLLPRLAASLADAALAMLLLMIMARLAPEAPQRADEKAPPFWTAGAFWLALAWAAHPLVLLVSASMGQLVSLPLLLVMLAAWYVEFSAHPRSDLAAPLALAAALCLQAWPLVALPVFLKAYDHAGERLRFAALALLPPLLLRLPALMRMDPGLGGEAHPLGLARALHDFGLLPMPAAAMGGAALLAAALLAYLVSPWRFPLIPALGLAALAALVALPVGVDALLWPLPFLLAVPGPLALRFGLAALGFALLHLGVSDPGAMFVAGRFFPPQTPPWFTPAWALANAGLWIYLCRETGTLFKLCRRPARLRFR